MTRSLLILGVFLGYAAAASAQSRPPDGGVGFDASAFRDEITPEQRARIVERLDLNRRRLRDQGLLPERSGRALGVAEPPLLGWPTAGTAGDPGHYGISNFVDHDPVFPDALEDYQCGTRTYDTDSGYNHRGLDVFSWPFPWLKMDRDEVEIVAAAPGIIIGKDDGNFDRNCSFVGSWNAVYVEHADGSVAWYGHLKKDSLTPKSVGQTVMGGEFLGVMGSSGQSTGPHLHLELYDSGDNLVDPYQGACNALNAESWWPQQPAYYEAGINLVATHDEAPEMSGVCGAAEQPHFATRFAPGQIAFFAVYLRDQQAGQPLELTIYQPDGTPWQAWDYTMTSPAHYAASWWYWYWFLPADPQPGAWRWNVRFAGREEESVFYVGEAVFDDSFESQLD